MSQVLTSRNAASPTALPTASSVETAQKSKAGAVGNILSWLFIALVAVIVAAVVVIPRILGAVPLTVLTGSMTPTIHPGDVVVVQPVPASELAVGDIVTFQAVSGVPDLTTHRIVAIETEGGQISSVTTRGDANNADDFPILPEQIQGRVRYHVPLIGYLTQGRNAILAGVALVGGGFLIYAINGAVKSVREKRDLEGAATDA